MPPSPRRSARRVAGAEQRSPRPPAAPRHPDRDRRRTGPCTPAPEPDPSARANRPRPGCRRAGECRRRSPAAPDRPWWPGRRSRPSRTTRRLLAAIRFTFTSWERSASLASAVRRPARRSRVPGRSRTPRCPLAPGRVVRRARPGRPPSCRGVAARVRVRRDRATSYARWNAASWMGTEGWPGSSAAARCDQIPTTSSAPASSASAAAAQTSGHTSAAAPLRDSPVSTLRCTRARRSVVAAAAASREIWSTDCGRDVDVGGDQWGRDPRPARTARPARGRCHRPRAEPGPPPGSPHPARCAGRPGRSSAGEHAVAVPVRLDHHHQLAASRRARCSAAMFPERVEVDLGAGRGRVDPGVAGSVSRPSSLRRLFLRSLQAAQLRASSASLRRNGPGCAGAVSACTEAAERPLAGPPGRQQGRADPAEDVADPAWRSTPARRARPRSGGCRVGDELAGALEQHGRTGPDTPRGPRATGSSVTHAAPGPAAGPARRRAV